VGRTCWSLDIGRRQRGELLEYGGEGGHAVLETSAARERATA
jgi:hypothetical protein